MIELSLCMIVRDEEKVLKRCLESVHEVVEEIIIIDTGSVDRTMEIAAAYTDKIYTMPWKNDFSAARNFAFSKAGKEYLLWMDADDVLPACEKAKLIALKKQISETDADCVMLPYDAAFDTQGRAVFTYERERIVRNCPQARWQGRVHEVIPPFGKILHGQVHLEHRKEAQEYSERNLQIYEQMRQDGVSLDAREQFYYARECYYHKKYAKAVIWFWKFLYNEAGWVENKIEACRFLYLCLMELEAEKEAVAALLQGLLLAPPNGELCCTLGQYFWQKGEWKQATFWYENALHAQKRTESGAFIEEDCYGYLPCIQLCVCYDRLGEREKAKMYNDMAGMFKPQDAAVEWNRKYFDKNEKSSG